MFRVVFKVEVRVPFAYVLHPCSIFRADRYCQRIGEGVMSWVALFNQQLSASTVLTLCFWRVLVCSDINRLGKDNDKKKDPLKPRVLMISISPDSPGQYIPMMNCIFAAQKAVGQVILSRVRYSVTWLPFHCTSTDIILF